MLISCEKNLEKGFVLLCYSLSRAKLKRKLALLRDRIHCVIHKNYKLKDIRSHGWPVFIFDVGNILDHKRLFEIGFNVCLLGKHPATR